MAAERHTHVATSRRTAARDERGAVLVHTAIALLTLMAFSALAIDAGALWVARGQAQNSADATALAGALSLAFDDPDDVARAQAAAKTTGEANVIMGATPSIVLGGATPDVRLVPCPPGMPGPPDTCVRADVYRSTARGNALPTFFAQIMNINWQNVRATATAAVVKGNAAECLKPWAVADKWHENWENNKASTAPWTTASVFDKYKKSGNDWLPDPNVKTPDVYTAPSADSPGTGFTPFKPNGDPSTDYGLQMTLKVGASENKMSSGWFLALDLPNPACGGGGNCYNVNIKTCQPNTYAIGDTLTVDSEQGNMVGPTKQGVETDRVGSKDGPSLKEQDPGAYWDDYTKSVQGSCAPGVCPDGKYHARSPRIVPIALFDIDAFFQGSPSGKTTVKITNIAGFFIEGLGGPGGKDVLGRLVAIAGVTKGASSVDDTASFMRKVLLVR